MLQRRNLLLPVLLAACGCSGEATRGVVEVPVRVGMVALDSHNIPVIVLEEEGGPRLLPIWIGMDAAQSITAEMEQQQSPRPNTHDLAKRVIQGLDGEIASVVVTKLREGTYYAILNLATDGKVVEIDARPSDAIAIALRVKAPIFVRAPTPTASTSRLPGLAMRSRPEAHRQLLSGAYDLHREPELGSGPRTLPIKHRCTRRPSLVIEAESCA
jgi:bifunctional DNase/RNase